MEILRCVVYVPQSVSQVISIKYIIRVKWNPLERANEQIQDTPGVLLSTSRERERANKSGI